MFTVGTPSFFVVFVVTALVALTGLALHESWRRGLQEERASGDNMCLCSDCHHLFLVRRETTGRCPQCGRLGKINRRKRAI